MKFKELANIRHSVRKFSSKKVENETLTTLLDVARKAPSAVNFQPLKVYVVTSEEKLEAIQSCYHREWFKAAPVVLVVVADYDSGWKRAGDNKNHADIDVAIFTDHLTLQAADMGLGTCWVCNFDVEETSELLGLTSKQKPVALIPVGYPADENIPVKKRKGLDEITVWI
ncbi:MAG: nitroreductase family protein [Prolixibacteraceae bacterium]|jgi:nitroreductase|nr:nitroreductase family protein [Prolixibacteraceae bacterium]